ncbi:MAG TPA: sugar ABC transporter substrate-binding protein [Steroidobacter sp.]|uniref:sugar ABC transporter substrate-binding protein n=1 Tax=Steroidobacter sp. TaxID=1978227 RepID=UPI002ED9091C
MNRRQAIAALSGAAFALAGCGRSSDRKELTFWGAGREGDIAAELIRGFEQENPQILVNVQKMPFTVAHEKLLTAYAGETLPDLCQLGNTWIPEFAALDALEPLDGYVSGSREIQLDDYFDGILASNRLDETLFGIPWYVDTRLLYYRRDLLREAGFDEPPQTWEEWSEMLGAIKQVVGPDRYSVLLPVNEFEPLLVLGLQLPSELLRDGGRYGNFRSDDFKRALTFYDSMFDRGFAPRMTNTQISNVWDEFGRGFFSFYISGPWNIAEFKRRLPPSLQNEWMTATMPGPDGPGLSSAGGSSLVVFKSSQAKAEAWLLAEYLSRPAVQQRFYDLTGDMPSRRSSWAMPALVESPYARAFLAQLDRVRSPPKVPEWERIATEMRLAGERVVQGVQTVDEAVIALDRKTDAILAKRRWMLERNTLPGTS